MSIITTVPTLTVREGTTNRIVMQLLADETAIDLSGVDHVELEMRDSKRGTYHYSSSDGSPKVGISDAANGKVYLEPPVTLFKTMKSPYLLYWWVYETGSEKYGVPEEIEAMIQVRRNY